MSEAPQYMTLDDAMKEIGVERTTLYYYAKRLQLEIKKFPLDKHAYMLIADVERVKQLRQAAKERKH